MAAVAGAVGKWESRAVGGISKRGGKVGFWTFPPRGFSTARRAVIFSAARHHRDLSPSPAKRTLPVLSQSDISCINDTGGVPDLIQGAQLAIALPPGVIRAGRGRLLFLGLGLSGCYRMNWNWGLESHPNSPPDRDSESVSARLPIRTP